MPIRSCNVLLHCVIENWFICFSWRGSRVWVCQRAEFTHAGCQMCLVASSWRCKSRVNCFIKIKYKLWILWHRHCYSQSANISTSLGHMTGQCGSVVASISSICLQCGRLSYLEEGGLFGQCIFWGVRHPWPSFVKWHEVVYGDTAKPEEFVALLKSVVFVVKGRVPASLSLEFTKQ